MLAFLAILAAGLCGYANAPALSWPAASIALASLSWAEHYLLIRRGIEAGLNTEIDDTLLRSFFNAVVATGACYWFGVTVRMVSGL